MSTPISMDDDDFMYLCSNSAKWADYAADWGPQIADGRFEAGGKAEQAPSLHWKRAYWVGTEYASVVLARMFLAGKGFESQTAVDLADTAEWVILTDYEREG